MQNTLIKSFFFVLPFIIGCLCVQAQTSSAASEQAYRKLQILSGRSLNASTRIPEDSLIVLGTEVETHAIASKNIAREFKAGQIQANAYGLKGNLGLAVNKAQQLLEKAQFEQNGVATGLAIQAIGDTYLHTGRLEQADSIFSKAEPYIRKHGDRFLQLQLLLQQLHAQIQLRDTLKSRITISQAYDILNVENYNIPEKNDYRLLLTFYSAVQAIHTGDMAGAFGKLKQIKQEKPSNGSLDMWSHLLSSTYYFASKEYDKALAHSDSTLLIAENEPNRNILQHMLWIRTQQLETTDMDKESCEIYTRLLNLNDSLYETRYISQIDSLHMAYWVDHLQMDNITRRNTLYTKVIGGLFALVLGTIVVILLVRKENRRLDASRLKLQAMRKATEESIRSKSLFLSNMSHELRTPLNAIVGFSTILTEDEELDEDTRQQCSGYIRQNADLLMKLVSDVVDFSGLKGDSIHFTFTSCDVVSLCRSVLETVGNVKQTQVKLHFITQFEYLELCTDKNRFQQVLINLLVNATKFTQGNGSITLELRTDPARDEAVFIVEDTGCGIPKEKQAQIFERFEKMQEGVQGAGLGLSICKLIVEHIGGRIWIDPEYTQGARFIFTHPLHYTSKEQGK